MIKFVKIVRQVVLFFALSTLLSGHQAVQASTYTSTWKGTTSTWSTAGNWTNAPSFSVVPEPSACYLALAAGVVLLYSRRRIRGLYSQK